MDFDSRCRYTFDGNVDGDHIAEDTGALASE